MTVHIPSLLKINYYLLKCFGFVQFSIENITENRPRVHLNTMVHLMHATLILGAAMFYIKFFQQFFVEAFISKLLASFSGLFIISMGCSTVIWSKICNKKIYTLFKTIYDLEVDFSKMDITLHYKSRQKSAILIMVVEVVLIFLTAIVHMICNRNQSVDVLTLTLTAIIYTTTSISELTLTCQFVTVYNNIVLMFTEINRKLSETSVSVEQLRRHAILHSRIYNILKLGNNLNTVLILIAFTARFVIITLELYGLVINAYINIDRTVFSTLFGICVLFYKLAVLIYIAQQVEDTVSLRNLLVMK
jgi:hypothetical protein